MGFKIIGTKFTPHEFEEYCQKLSKQLWVSRIVLHNTAVPSLKQRIGGVLTKTHILNLQSYYEKKGWNGGPHLFVDATGIWVFNPLDRKGTHSPSYNGSSWGVEMLGDFESESFSSGLGKQVRDNSVAACRSLMNLQKWANLQDQRLILHKEDKLTDHNCPGKNVNKSEFIKMVQSEIVKPSEMKVIYESGTGPIVIEGAFIKDGVTYAPVRTLGTVLGFRVAYSPQTNKTTIFK